MCYGGSATNRFENSRLNSTREIQLANRFRFTSLAKQPSSWERLRLAFCLNGTARIAYRPGSAFNRCQRAARCLIGLARRVVFLLTWRAPRLLDAALMQAARGVHFLMWGTPEIDLAKFGPKQHKPAVCIEGGRPNQLTPTFPGKGSHGLDTDAHRWGY